MSDIKTPRERATSIGRYIRTIECKINERGFSGDEFWIDWPAGMSQWEFRLVRAEYKKHGWDLREESCPEASYLVLSPIECVEE